MKTTTYSQEYDLTKGDSLFFKSSTDIGLQIINTHAAHLQNFHMIMHNEIRYSIYSLAN